ncbi:hypothetical protein [Streptomyces sp. 8N706]|uniref:hypothetical protein n=1 Tax=Streptomyces sp. 8N706 TaxID=3457416 RepID=UPI003FD2507E
MGDVVALDGLQSNFHTLKTEGGNFGKIGQDFDDAVTRLMDGLHALGGGPPGTQKTLSGGSTPAEPPPPSTAEQFWSGLTTLNSKAGAPPWGDDDIGEKFGVVYEGLRDGMYESMGHLAAKLKEIGKALEGMAKNHEANEDFNDSLMKQHIQNTRGEHKAMTSLTPPRHT